MKFNELIPELAVFNIEKSLSFYVRVIGFSIKYERKDEGFAFIQLGRSQIMLDEIEKGRTWKTGEFTKPLGIGINLQIEVNDISSIVKRLDEGKIKLFINPEEKWYKRGKIELGNKQFLVQDPDGYLLRFFEDMGERKI